MPIAATSIAIFSHAELLTGHLVAGQQTIIFLSADG
jgi:hypothetical protein